MEQQLREILNSLYEAEALLEMALHRPDGKRESIIALAREKCFQAADKAFSLKVSDAAPESAAREDSSEDTAPEQTPAPAPEEKDASELLFEEKIAPVLAEAAAPESETAPGSEETPAMLAVASAEEETAEELTSEAYAEVMPDEEPPAPAPREKPAPCEKAAPADDQGAREGEHGPEQDSPEPPTEPEDLLEEPDYGDDEADDREEERRSMRIISRRPIASFFSINDKFRFRRELFSNSNPEWLNALALLETMADLSEAEDYLFDDLQWDRESPDVEAFVQVLTRYYNS